MANESQQTITLPMATSMGSNDCFMIISNAGTANASTRLLPGHTLGQTLFAMLHSYANNAAAVTGGLPVGALYQANGVIMIVV